MNIAEQQLAIDLQIAQDELTKANKIIKLACITICKHLNLEYNETKIEAIKKMLEEQIEEMK